ncbi:MAG: 23S rRNA (adenine(1618)-N(6))-methyltransferase RlmF [Bacteroidales bacterium]|nr:23S rRNA (adenine(1618)-N(6))-methyltransferase RlmF [Bacteroidales bacterium]
MVKKIVLATQEKSSLHPRNPHRFRYDFKALTACCQELAKYVAVNKYNNESIDFANPDAVKALNRALLKHFYGITDWDIPVNYLCPPIPGRADYIHYMADLLASGNGGEIPRGEQVRVLDIGIGANCVYPIIGSREYGWSFVGTDVDPVAIESARKIVEMNSVLHGKVELRLQPKAADIFTGIIKPGEQFDLSVCNPPFHSSLEEAAAATKRKLHNLNPGNTGKRAVQNFGGQNVELIYAGGEEAFVRRMIQQSSRIPQQCKWFSTLIARSEHLPAVYKSLEIARASEVKTIDMAQGQKVSRVVVWRF